MSACTCPCPTCGPADLTALRAEVERERDDAADRDVLFELIHAALNADEPVSWNDGYIPTAAIDAAADAILAAGWRAPIETLIARREAWEAEQRAAGQIWVATYYRFHSKCTDDHYTLSEALGQLYYGEENCDLSAVSVTCPDGTVITDIESAYEALPD